MSEPDTRRPATPGQPSIHRAPWPRAEELAQMPAPADGESLVLRAAARSAIPAPPS